MLGENKMARPTEAKVWGSVLASTGISALIGIFTAVQTDPHLLGNLPAPVQGLILLVVPPAVTWLGGYLKRSRTSTVSDGYQSNAPFRPVDNG